MKLVHNERSALLAIAALDLYCPPRQPESVQGRRSHEYAGGLRKSRPQDVFFLDSCRGCSSSPSVIAAFRNVENSAHAGHRMLLSHGFNLTVFHRDSFAKWAAHFFSRSCYNFTSDNSFLTRANSSFVSVVSDFCILPTVSRVPVRAA